MLYPWISETEIHTPMLGVASEKDNVPGSRKGIERVMLEECHYETQLLITGYQVALQLRS